DLLAVRLVAAGPVRGLLGVGSAQHLEHLLEALVVDDVTDADEIAVLGRHLDREVPLRHLELEVQLLLAADHPLGDLLDESRTVVRADDALADSAGHELALPFPATDRKSTRL